ncbi:MAG: histidinol-phosphate transaminase [Woeseiaceae bacterium]|nr:histidinol-phosphate transaminase [Woeseiaceae bacterium]
MPIQYSRREVFQGLIGGAVGLALTPISLASLGPPAGMIALRYNENPYGPSPAALEAAERAAALGAYYADDLQQPLLETIAARQGVALENMVLCSGSNEGLQAAFVAWGRQGRIVVPGLTYSDHYAYATRMGAELVRVPLKADLTIDLEAMAAAVGDDVSLVYICNPNNPTGHTLDGDRLRDFCRDVGKRAVVLIDEAYNEITDRPEYTSMVDLVRAGENVIVMRTFSKIFGMAGLRVGYGIARPDLAQTIDRHVMAWPNGVGMAAAQASYTDDEFIRFSRAKILEGRKIVVDAFREHGIEALPSQTNFVLADIGRNGAAFQDRMAERGILIRGRFSPIPNHIRVSMGRIEDLEVFRDVFGELIRT